ncbi:MAG: DNA repair protein RadC [Dehalococcoidia bacterium]|nr:DNA repair protein RadC [Dehalococcoidia bacterium]
MTAYHAPGAAQAEHRGVSDDLVGAMPAPAEEEPAAPVEYRARVMSMPEEERPRERLGRLGPEALRVDELLAILFGTGTRGKDVLEVAQALLQDRAGLRGLGSADIPTLSSTDGVGVARASQVVAAFELGRRLGMDPAAARPQVTSPEQIASLLHDRLQVLEHEELHVLPLDRKNRLIAAPSMTYRGTVNSAGARVAEVFKLAVRLNASKIALAHNHPSGDPTPSEDDVHLTRLVVEAGRTLDIEVLDHLVFGHGAQRWVSLRRRRLGFDGG